MELCHAQMIMKEHGVNQVPVVKNIYERTHPIGLLDPDSISLTYRFCYIFSMIYLYRKYAPFYWFSDPGNMSFSKHIYLISHLFLILKGLTL